MCNVLKRKTMLWTVVWFFIFWGMVDFVLALRNELGTWTNSEEKIHARASSTHKLPGSKGLCSLHSPTGDPALRPRILLDRIPQVNWLSAITAGTSFQILLGGEGANVPPQAKSKFVTYFKRLKTCRPPPPPSPCSRNFEWYC